MGFSADLDMKGAGSSLSVNGGKTNLNSDYKAVGEQSGIFANEADLITQGKGTFKGGVFVTSKAAQDNGNSNIVFKQGVTATDLKNTTSYDGDAISIGLSAGKERKPSMSGLGYGTDSDSDSSITKGGVSGYNDPQGIFTTDNREALEGKLANSFDASRVNEELGAQTQITQEFGKEATKAVGDFANNRIKAIIADTTLSNAEKNEAIAKWDEGGIYRVAAHTALGALGIGSVEGALTTGGLAAAAPTFNKVQEKIVESLIASGMSEDVAKGTASGVISLTLLGAGSVAGLDTSSTVTAINVDANNRKLHLSEIQVLNSVAKKLVKSKGGTEEYWNALLYAVTLSHLDSKGASVLQRFEDELNFSMSGTQSEEKRIVKGDLVTAENAYNELKAQYANNVLPKDKYSNSKQKSKIIMFDSSGYYNDNYIYYSIDSGKDCIGKTPTYTANQNNLQSLEKLENHLSPVVKGEILAAPASLASSVVLRANMISKGLALRHGEEAHHIVAGNVRAFAPARKRLAELGIDINAPSNGVALSGSRKTGMTKNGFQWGATPDMYALNHRASGLHSEKMARYVLTRLNNATTKADAEKVLKNVALAIKDGSIK